MGEINDYSGTAGSNNAESPNGWKEGILAGALNNSDREFAARVKRHYADNNGSLATGGTSTAITVTLNAQHSAWFDGLTFAARITTTCGATPTINPTGSAALGAKSLYWAGSGTQLAADDLTATAVAWFMYELTSDKVYVFAAPPVVAASSETVAGKAELATQAETDTGTDDARIVTPLKLKTVGANHFTGAQTAIATDTTRGTVEFAVQSEMETGTSNVLVVTPGRQHFHPSAAKCWGYVTGGGTPVLTSNYNITSIADTNPGKLTVTIATDFSDENYCVVAHPLQTAAGGGNTYELSTARAAGAFEIHNTNEATTASDPVAWCFVAYGDQA